MVTVVANQKGGVGKTTTAANIGALFARRGRRVLVVDTDPQFALTRQLGLEARSLGVNLVDVLAGRAGAADAIVRGRPRRRRDPGRRRARRRRDEPRRGARPRAVPARRARAGRRRLRRGRDRHAAEPRAADRQRARLRGLRARAGQRRGRGRRARHPRAPRHDHEARQATRRRGAAADRAGHAVEPDADQQPHGRGPADRGGPRSGRADPAAVGVGRRGGRRASAGREPGAGQLRRARLRRGRRAPQRRRWRDERPQTTRPAGRRSPRRGRRSKPGRSRRSSGSAVAGRLRDIPIDGDPRRTRLSRASASTSRRSPRWRTRSESVACCSR